MSTATDPVCGMQVDSESGRSLEYAGQRYYFCSQRCLHEFEADPAKYTGGDKAGTAASHEHGHARAMPDAKIPKAGREMAKDPICGMVVEKATSLKSERGGR
ncbi:MAG: YHS domain-containing protein, partial [Gallionella sp.]